MSWALNNRPSARLRLDEADKRMPSDSFTTPRAVAFWSVVWLGFCTVTAPAASMQTILTNGPTANRLNVVMLSEGYTSNQLSQFLVDATNAVNALLSLPPYLEYQRYFNAFAISVASNQSGADHPQYGFYRDTYFNSTFDGTSDRIITIPPNSQDTNSANGQGKVDALLQTFMPSWSLAILLVNDGTPGGSGGKIAIASAGSDPSLFVHECGHALGGLGDEYDSAYADQTVSSVEQPNTTRQTNRASVKWNAWIDPTIPVPTTPQDSYPGVIGLFEGANYQATGWYRPKLDCLMRSYGGVPFCEVCRETMVLSLYRKVRPVDGFTPANTNLFITSPQSLNFTLVTLQPTTHRLSVQWSTNGTPMAGATNTTFVLPALPGNGNYSVKADVLDATPLVRSDPTNLLRQTVTWTVNVSLAELHLDSPQRLSGGRFTFQVTGYGAQNFVIQASTDLAAWTPLVTNSLTDGHYSYTNYEAANLQRRYFRAQALR